MSAPRIRDALAKAEEALSLLQESIREGFHGDTLGIDEVEAGLDAMSSALAPRVLFPEVEQDFPPELDEVLSFLSSQGRVDDEASALARRLIGLVKIARYQHLPTAQRDEAEDVRERLYGHLEALVTSLQQEPARD